jgi:hypothetical protein
VRVVPLLLALTGCSQIFGLDSPRPVDADIATGDAPLTDAHSIDTTPGSDAYVTVSFQQDINQYLGTLDTYVDSGNPNQNKGTDTSIRMRSANRWGLLQFQQIFGTMTIPAGKQVVSARLDIYMSSTNCMGHIADVAVAWDEAVTYNTFGADPGVDATDLGATGPSVPTSPGLQSMIVTDTLNRWSADPTKNFGWIFVSDGTGGAGGDCLMQSSEFGTVANRPRLVVTFIP